MLMPANLSIPLVVKGGLKSVWIASSGNLLEILTYPCHSPRVILEHVSVLGGD